MVSGFTLGRFTPSLLALSVILMGMLLIVAPTAGASNQETTAEPSTVSFTFIGEFKLLPFAEMEFEVIDPNGQSVLLVNQDENNQDHQLVLDRGIHLIEARANFGPLSLPMKSVEFDSQEYSHFTMEVQLVPITEAVSILAVAFLARSAFRTIRKSFGRPIQTASAVSPPRPVSELGRSQSLSSQSQQVSLSVAPQDEDVEELIKQLKDLTKAATRDEYDDKKDLEDAFDKAKELADKILEILGGDDVAKTRCGFLLDYYAFVFTTAREILEHGSRYFSNQAACIACINAFEEGNHGKYFMGENEGKAFKAIDNNGEQLTISGGLSLSGKLFPPFHTLHWPVWCRYVEDSKKLGHIYYYCGPPPGKVGKCTR